MVDPDNEIHFDAMPYFRIYKSGRTERTDVRTKFTPPSADVTTGVSSKDTAVVQEPGISARVYIPTAVLNSSERLPLLVYYHGGGFCFGSAFGSELHSYLNSLVAEANIVVVSVEYRLAPEHPIPAAYDDSWLAVLWVASHAEGSGTDAWLTDHADFDRVFLAGESAGGNIAHHMALRAGTDDPRLRHDIRVKGLVLLHPYFLETEETESDAIDPGMSLGLKKLWKIACPSSTGIDDDRINPVGAGPTLSLGCDYVLVCVGEMDVLRDRGRAYYEKLRSCCGWKGEVEIYESQGEGHVFHISKPDCEEALALRRKISSFLNL